MHNKIQNIILEKRNKKPFDVGYYTYLQLEILNAIQFMDKDKQIKYLDLLRHIRYDVKKIERIKLFEELCFQVKYVNT